MVEAGDDIAGDISRFAILREVEFFVFVRLAERSKTEEVGRLDEGSGC